MNASDFEDNPPVPKALSDAQSPAKSSDRSLKRKANDTDSDICNHTKKAQLNRSGPVHEDLARVEPRAASANAFRLLDLPAELRNLVYKFALTSEHGLRATVARSISPGRVMTEDEEECRDVAKLKLHERLPREPDSPEFNQLKYVCRQLYQETAGIEQNSTTWNSQSILRTSMS